MSTQKHTENKKPNTIVNIAKLDPKSPIPLETDGKGYIVSKGRKYAPFLDDKDNFFQILMEAALLSPTNKSCIGSKAKFSIGKGLQSQTEDAEFSEWAKRVNPKGHTLNKILKKVFASLYACGNCFVNLVKTKVAGKSFVYVYVKNHMDCRVLIPETGTIPTQVVISKNFRRKGVWNLTDEKQYVTVDLYNGDPKQKWTKLDGGDEHLIIHLKNEEEGYDYYGVPSNVACLPQQILEYKMARYNMDNFDNNLVIGGLIVLQGNLTPDESGKIAKEITGAHTGDGKRGKYVILSSEAGVENSKVINFDQNKEYDFIQGSKRIEEQIIFANEWSKALIDPQTGGVGNSGKQIRELYETKMNTVISPVQAMVLDELIMPIISVCDTAFATKWSTYEFAFKSLPILGISSEVDVNAVMTVDEGRAAIGLPELGGTEGKQRIKQTVNDKPNVQS